VLTDPGTDQAMARAQSEYARRREVMRDGLLEASGADGLGLTVPIVGPDGIHIWITLPAGCDAGRVVEAVAQRGFLLAGGQPFFTSQGNQSHLRINAGLLSVDIVPAVASAVCEAVKSTLGEPTALLTP